MKAQRTCSFKPLPKWSWVEFWAATSSSRLRQLSKAAALLFVFYCLPLVAAEPLIFRLHTFREPESLNPLKQKNSNAGYITQQLFLPPLQWKNGNLRSGFLKACASKDYVTWSCEFEKKLKYSDGSELKSEDFVDHIKLLLDPQNASVLAPELFSIKNARETFEKKEGTGPLGVSVQGTRVLFTLITPDFEFPLRLINANLSPFKVTAEGNIIGTGAYAFDFWNRGERIRLKPNMNFKGGHKDRPPVEFIFQAEDTIALKLYENNEISFLRRLPTLFFAKYLNSPELFKIDQIRFDYFGFGKSIWSLSETLPPRKFIAENLPYKDMGVLLASKPRPGCFGLPANWSAGPICYPEGNAKPPEGLLKTWTMSFSQNVDDNKRVLEWLQNTLLTNWKWRLNLDGLENKTYLDRVESRKLSFFRKGLAPDRPSCAGVLENFVSSAHENYIDFSNAEYDKTLLSLKTEASPKKRIQLCRKALEILRNQYVMIPTGPIYFTVLAKPQWTGWSLNEINALDLSQLHLKTKN